MNKSVLMLAASTLLSLFVACSPGKKSHTDTPDSTATESTKADAEFEDDAALFTYDYKNFLSSEVIAYQDSLLFFYNLDEDMGIPFHLQEPDEIFNFKFDPDAPTMYYIVVRQGILWLRKATFSEEGAKLEDLLNLKISTKQYPEDFRSPLYYNKGKLLIESNFSMESYSFSDYHIYTIADNKLTKTNDVDKAAQLFGKNIYATVPESDKRFKVEQQHLFYSHAGRWVCLTDQLNLKAGEYEGSAIDEVEYLQPTVSPDGSKIAFVAITEFGDMAHGPLCIADADGKNQRILLKDGAFPSVLPQWLGNRLFYIDIYNDPMPEDDNDQRTKQSLFGTDSENTGQVLFQHVRRFDVKNPISKTKKVK